MTLWLFPLTTPGLSRPGPFDGLGLRGNASRPVAADGVIVPADAMLGADGAGLDIAPITLRPPPESVAGRVSAPPVTPS